MYVSNATPRSSFTRVMFSLSFSLINSLCTYRKILYWCILYLLPQWSHLCKWSQPFLIFQSNYRAPRSHSRNSSWSPVPLYSMCCFLANRHITLKRLLLLYQAMIDETVLIFSGARRVYVPWFDFLAADCLWIEYVKQITESWFSNLSYKICWNHHNIRPVDSLSCQCKQ